MNVLAATTLSTRTEAYALHRVEMGQFITWYETQYVYIIKRIDDDTYQFQIFHVTHVSQGEGNRRKAVRAVEPHFEGTYTFEDLKTFLKDRAISFDEIWSPLEDDTYWAKGG